MALKFGSATLGEHGGKVVFELKIYTKTNYLNNPHHSSAMFARKILREYQSLLAFQLSQRIQLKNIG
jgi:hypothetical protein